VILKVDKRGDFTGQGSEKNKGVVGEKTTQRG